MRISCKQLDICSNLFYFNSYLLLEEGGISYFFVFCETSSDKLEEACGESLAFNDFSLNINENTLILPDKLAFLLAHLVITLVSSVRHLALV